MDIDVIGILIVGFSASIATGLASKNVWVGISTLAAVLFAMEMLVHP